MKSRARKSIEKVVEDDDSDAGVVETPRSRSKSKASRGGKRSSNDEQKSDPVVTSEEEPSLNPAPISPQKVIVRTISACVMTILYLLMLQAGHFYCLLVGLISQFEMFRELVNVRYVEAKSRSMPLFRTLQWSWFTLVMLYVHGRHLHKFCSSKVQMQYIALSFTRYIDYIVFVGGCLVFMGTVLTFKKDLVRFQISQTFWTISTTSIVVALGEVFARNIMNGLFWFFFPMATVVMNDVSAYFCGITFGRRFIKAPFLSLSPNKTWEGFIGAGILTVIFSFFFPLLLVRWKWFTCPQTNGLELSPFPEPLSCDVNPVFLPAEYHFFGDNSIEILPIQLHGMVYGLFASIVSPFGGFFASAIKRAYNKKDFDSFMPGHGGLMDRMDCQIVMISFCYVHYMTFIRTKVVSVDEVMRLVQQMTTASQQDLYIQLGKYIAIENSH